MNSSKYFALNRLSLAEAALAEGYEVVVAAPCDDPKSTERIEKVGIKLHPWSLKRRGLSFFSTLRSLYHLSKIMHLVKPDVVHSLTIKPVILSGLVTQLLKIPMVALIPGRGSAFDRWPHSLIAQLLYRMALRAPSTQVCFQNKEDQTLFETLHIVEKEKSTLIPGSGVDTSRYFFQPYCPIRKERVVTMAARLLKQKGVLEFVEAAKEVKRTHPKVEFRLAGDPDPGNPNSLSKEIVETLCQDAGIDYLGHVDDMPHLLLETDIFCLPTYYPEGIPMTLLQAASMGNALIATDVPGCREVVIDGTTGILIPPQDADALSYAIKRLLIYPNLCRKMSHNCRNRLEQHFAQHIIHKSTLKLYKKEFAIKS